MREIYVITVLLAEQNARRALENGDRMILLFKRRVMYDNDAKKLQKHPELGKVHFSIRIA